MACCGQGRAALRGAGSPTTADERHADRAGGPPGRAGPRPASTVAGEVRLRWRNHASGTIAGPVTGRAYRVSGQAPVVEVDRRDAAALLRSGFFTLA